MFPLPLLYGPRIGVAAPAAHDDALQTSGGDDEDTKEVVADDDEDNHGVEGVVSRLDSMLGTMLLDMTLLDAAAIAVLVLTIADSIGAMTVIVTVDIDLWMCELQ